MLLSYQELLLEALLVENQLEYLSKKYANINPELIQQAIDLDKKNAEKLVFGLANGVIDKIDQESIAAVANLDPFAKASRKSEADLAYEAEIKAAKQINPKYWQWILRIRRADPDSIFDRGIFDYLEAEDLTTDDILDKSLDDINRASERWHTEQFANQAIHGTYEKTPQNSAMLKVGAYAWVPVDEKDSRIEGAKMQNCIGTYCRVTPENKIYSLRNSYNNPHVSINVKKTQSGIWQLEQIKGKQNRQPIAKYVPYILPFVEKLFEKGVDPSNSHDFWSLESPDLIKYVKYIKQSIFASSIPKSFINIVSDEFLNDNIKKYGLTEGYNLWGGRDENESIIKRLTHDTIVSVLQPGKLSPATASKFFKAVIKFGAISEDETASMLENFDLTRSVKMVIMARFKSQEFLQELKKIDPEDLLLVLKNYIEGIEAFPYTDPYFTQVLRIFFTNVGRNYQMGDYIKSIMSKTPSADLMTILQERSTTAQTFEDIFLAKELLSRVKTPDIQTYSNILKYVKPDFDNRSVLNDIIFSLDYEELPALYDAGNHIITLNDLLTPLIALIRNIVPNENRRILPGTSEDVAKAAEFILNTDDREQLLELRRATNSRGIKVMVDRKLARLNRAKK